MIAQQGGTGGCGDMPGDPKVAPRSEFAGKKQEHFNGVAPQAQPREFVNGAHGDLLQEPLLIQALHRFRGGLEQLLMTLIGGPVRNRGHLHPKHLLPLLAERHSGG